MAEPPLLVGAVQRDGACGVAALAVTMVGAPGAWRPGGVTEVDGAEAGQVPAALVAATLKV